MKSHFHNSRLDSSPSVRISIETNRTATVKIIIIAEINKNETEILHMFARFVAQDETPKKTTEWVKRTRQYLITLHTVYFMKKVFGCGGLSNVNKLIPFRSFFRVSQGIINVCVCVPNKYVGCLWMIFFLGTCTLTASSRKKNVNQKWNWNFIFKNCKRTPSRWRLCSIVWNAVFTISTQCNWRTWFVLFVFFWGRRLYISF